MRIQNLLKCETQAWQVKVCKYIGKVKNGQVFGIYMGYISTMYMN